MLLRRNFIHRFKPAREVVPRQFPSFLAQCHLGSVNSIGIMVILEIVAEIRLISLASVKSLIFASAFPIFAGQGLDQIIARQFRVFILEVFFRDRKSFDSFAENICTIPWLASPTARDFIFTGVPPSTYT
jgi:hypothetical protein